MTLGTDRLYREWFEPYRPRDYEGLVEESLDGARKRISRVNSIDGFLGLGISQESGVEARDEASGVGAVRNAVEAPIMTGVATIAETQDLRSRRSSGSSTMTLVGAQDLQKAQQDIVVREVELEGTQAIAA